MMFCCVSLCKPKGQGKNKYKLRAVSESVGVFNTLNQPNHAVYKSRQE